MFFIASKILGIIFEPVAFLILVGLVGIVLSFTHFARRWGQDIAVTAWLLLAIACFSPLGAILLRPLEDRFPTLLHPAAPFGIVVLGGALDQDIGAARGAPTITEAAARLTSGAALARRFPASRLVFTGGSANLRQEGDDEARGVHDLWLSLGVPEAQMAFESKSRNTYENATMTRDLVKPSPGQTWLLVTSAAHMPRAIGIFRKIGWPMIAYPVDYRTFGDGRDFKPTVNAFESLHRLDAALHEWIGLAAYWFTSKTSAIFPGP